MTLNPTYDAQAAADGADDADDAPVMTLKELLAEALQQKADTERLKEGRKIIREKRVLPSAAMAELLADVKRIETVREWLPKAQVAMFQMQHCQHCESYNPVFTGLFQRQAHRTMRDTHRWLAVPEAQNLGLPQEVKTSVLEIPMCGFCLPDHGFPGEELGFTQEAAEETADDSDGEAEELDEELQELADDMATDEPTSTEA